MCFSQTRRNDEHSSRYPCQLNDLFSIELDGTMMMMWLGIHVAPSFKDIYLTSRRPILLQRPQNIHLRGTAVSYSSLIANHKTLSKI